MKETYSTATQDISEELTPTSAGERKSSDRVQIVLALLALYIIWGSTYLGMRLAIASIPPFLMAGVRFLIAGVLLYAYLRLRGAANPSRAQWIGAAIAGILLAAIGNGGVTFAEQWVASGLAAVAVGAVPLWTALFAGLMGRWPTRLEWLGLALGFVGLILLNLEHGMWASPIGAVSLILAPMGWALGSALSPRLTLPAGLMSSATQMLVAGSVLLVLALASGERMQSLPTASSLLAIAYLIAIGSIVAYSAYGYLLRRVRPALATSYAYVNPVVAVGLGVGLAGEHITLLGVLAMLVILTGVGIVSLGRNKRI
jgi:drug/metabolite transporter (DMT)-like permease